MTHFIYGDNAGAYEGPAIDFTKIDASKGYARHFNNSMTLDFIAKNTRDAKERVQATKEQEICARKMRWFSMHANFDQTVATRLCEEIKRNWQSKRP